LSDRGDKFYRIENLEDILAKFRAELELAIRPIEERLTRLEGMADTIKPTTRGERVPDIIKTKYYKYGVTEETTSEEDMTEARIHAMSTITAIGAARRAMYGYAMLLDQMGLSKDQKQMIRQVEASISAMMRLMQTMRMVQLAMATSGPYGWIYLAMAGGMGAAALMYGNRTMGGG
jgi:hypothetical protein